MVTLKIHNSLSGKKEDFIPLNPAHVGVYACGPTVYSYAHIGNGRMAVVFDLLVRVLKQIFPKVTYVSNITDVDDKIIKAHLETGEDIGAMTRRFEAIYNDDMAKMGVSVPDIQPRATEHIQEMINLIGTLIQQGHAYAEQNHVMFHVPSFPAYGSLSRRSRDEQVAGARVDVAPYKKDPADFVLWKPSKDDEPGWESPWGRGRPGWHIECSAMAEKHLGLPFDIHGGGADLKFPHHENEIAQSCCAHGHKNDLSAFSKYWMHNGFVTVSGEKMSKSIGNIRLVHDLLEHYKGEVLRLTLLSAHYRQPLDFSEDTLKQSQQILDRLYNILNTLKDVEAIESDVPETVMAALCDDLNTPKALAELNSIAKQAAKAETDENKALYKGQLLVAGHLIGILQDDPASWLGQSQNHDSIDGAYVEALLQERQTARAEKNFARADEIRNELDAMGVTIIDTPDGPQWHVKAG